MDIGLLNNVAALKTTRTKTLRLLMLVLLIKCSVFWLNIVLATENSLRRY